MTGKPRLPKPLPDVEDPWYQPFWEGTRRCELRLQHCQDCGYVRWPPAPICPECLSTDAIWEVTSTDATIYSFGIYEHCYNEAFRDEIPYNVAMVELDAGPKMMSNIVGADNDEIQIGMRVTGLFDRVNDEVTLLKFRPSAHQGDNPADEKEATNAPLDKTQR